MILNSDNFLKYSIFIKSETNDQLFPFGSIIYLDRILNDSDKITIKDILAIESYYVTDSSTMIHKIFNKNQNNKFKEDVFFTCKDRAYNFSAVDFFIKKYLHFSNPNDTNRNILCVLLKDNIYKNVNNFKGRQLTEKVRSWGK
ncbi:MAG: hypothetical protein NT007_06925 [Candidatus Kapabacteria bacterium]|nr:hypothetical protein [Candidatus Kapabacteria bacterium]